ncbi:MAG: ATP-binding protein [Phycisphaerales bacterium]
MRPRHTTLEIKNANRVEEPSPSLADFITANIEPILVEWESFARKISQDPKMDRLALRDHAADILQAIVHDMGAVQDKGQQASKSQGDEDEGASHLIRTAAQVHASTRLHSGFDALELVAEYRALRASVLRLWQKTRPSISSSDLEAVNRFNESIDQSLAVALERFTTLVDRSRQFFLGILGHDLRNPLAAISMNAQVMSKYGNPDEKTARMAADIRSSADAMQQLIDDLLDFAGTQLGTSMPIEKAAIELGSLCREVVDETCAGFPKSSCDLRLPDNEIHGHWDRTRIRQMLSNLLSNTCQHGAGPIDFHVTEEGDDVRLVIGCKAEAIPPDVLPTIFDPLVRSLSETKGKNRKGSLGLGLYIVREVVHGHGGTIDVESSEDAGTVFTIRLPRDAED